MEKHFKEQLSIQELAFLCYQSTSTFKRNFEKYFNTSPAEWIKNRRLKEAHNLLLNTPQSISNIAYEVGFENVSHFIKLFKEKFHYTPKQIQKEPQGIFFEH